LSAVLSGFVPSFDLIGYAQSAHRRLAIAEHPVRGRAVVIVDKSSGANWSWVAYHVPHLPCLLPDDAEFSAWLAHWETAQSALGALDLDRERADAPGHGGEELGLLQIAEQDSFVVKLVNSTLLDAVKSGASDIHFEAIVTGLTIKLRIDGILVEAGSLHSPVQRDQLVSRIKVMADLDVAEQRIPQDGRFQAAHLGRSVDVRVSIMPSIHGEDVVLRLLDRQALIREAKGLSLAGLGLGGNVCDAIRSAVREPYGMVLITGPTGSGKTTTVYAALSETRDPREKVVTIEDPVEYQLDGVLQIPVNERKGLTFSRGLRSILRHDPDRILVGEIRDRETAEIAVQSALTGHLVLTTVHANNVFDVLGRFAQFGIDPYSLASALRLVVAQRLLRRICPACLAQGTANAPNEADPPTMRCARCRGTGYRGRFAVGEVLNVTPAIKECIAQRAPIGPLESAARSLGYVSLRQQALDAVRAGITTNEEVARATGLA